MLRGQVHAQILLQKLPNAVSDQRRGSVGFDEPARLVQRPDGEVAGRVGQPSISGWIANARIVPSLDHDTAVVYGINVQPG
ncbi:MAG: hypothetical protein HKP61_21070 [Dactylosporangium sp.]|nr:hypothetical protein [Dactylosporangium sp.]NNJ63373.1 hypothetical protein [Dactylosporangium sp.]